MVSDQFADSSALQAPLVTPPNLSVSAVQSKDVPSATMLQHAPSVKTAYSCSEKVLHQDVLLLAQPI